MTYSVSIKASALKALERIDRENRRRIVTAIDSLAGNPSAGSVLKGEFEGLRRLRVGAYRIVYEVRDAALVVLVVRIGHRREVYR
jgi:mRNA interferase RelE/StbE